MWSSSTAGSPTKPGGFSGSRLTLGAGFGGWFSRLGLAGTCTLSSLSECRGGFLLEGGGCVLGGLGGRSCGGDIFPPYGSILGGGSFIFSSGLDVFVNAFGLSGFFCGGSTGSGLRCLGTGSGLLRVSLSMD